MTGLWRFTASSRRRRRHRPTSWRWPVNGRKNSSEDMTMKTKKKTPRSAAKFRTLDDFLDSEGKREEFEAVAIKEVLAWQIAEAMRTGNISRARLAARMKTSRSQV